MYRLQEAESKDPYAHINNAVPRPRQDGDVEGAKYSLKPPSRALCRPQLCRCLAAGEEAARQRQSASGGRLPGSASRHRLQDGGDKLRLVLPYALLTSAFPRSFHRGHFLTDVFFFFPLADERSPPTHFYYHTFFFFFFLFQWGKNIKISERCKVFLPPVPPPPFFWAPLRVEKFFAFILFLFFCEYRLRCLGRNTCILSCPASLYSSLQVRIQAISMVVRVSPGH